MKKDSIRIKNGKGDWEGKKLTIGMDLEIEPVGIACWGNRAKWTAPQKLRQEVKGRPTLNGEVYGFGPETVQSRSEDRGDARDR